MQLGVSSWSFARSLQSGRMSILDVIDWVAASDADHLEIAVASLTADLPREPDLVAAIKRRAADTGVTIANYVVNADFRGDRAEAELVNIKSHIDVAHELGSKLLRHDIVDWGWRDSSQAEYEQTLAAMIPICQELADYAASFGMTTMVENHGFFNNNSERVRRLLSAVNRSNFRTLLDVGNSLCVDEDPLAAIPYSLPFASVVHLKDFYIRGEKLGPDGWISTLAGRGILGSIVGFGDLPIRKIIGLIKAGGFDGPMSIEFEGIEDEALAVTTGLRNARRYWDEAPSVLAPVVHG